MQSDILLHLTHWQYWFWFWFTYYMVLYYFIFLRLIRYRVLKMSPKMSTTFRSHGKWGDLIVCFVPLSWCTNILSNSNFILRMVEWQSESSLFTVRVRGKQWYWVYKFELKSLLGVESASKNVGHNYWVESSKPNQFHTLRQLQYKHNIGDTVSEWSLSGSRGFAYANVSNSASVSSRAASHNSLLVSTLGGVSPTTPLNTSLGSLSAFNRSLWGIVNLPASARVEGNALLCKGDFTGAGSTLTEVTRIDKVTASGWAPIRLRADSGLSKLDVVASNPDMFHQKTPTSNFYLVIKQKRYAATKLVRPSMLSSSPKSFDQGAVTSFNQYQMSLGSGVNSQSNRRLLRTKRVLVLPTHVNLTVITNSFDVMHSWYIPGLGVKLDCVPGRSTHHTIHIDHSGFYYGQCAEICGRYHHHMPIRICALPFEHFLLWWTHFGAPFFLSGNINRSKYLNPAIRQINW